ncbi:hypothetical protein [Roseivirga sp. E12]|uniref:hypothetical protein n=1 Tax=Roseivirga sp. E12 TaxID=2819237 RepID=UPI001ABC8A94|nr:hypothetical protein [Roseivirga sp. E12]MBO3700800.1 hypothetical protein [Roseivirga sp. E12]
MKKVFLLLLLFICFTACDNTNEGSLERVYFENSELSTPEDEAGTWVSWSSGANTAIRFAYTHPDEVNIADDELTEFFWIEIPPGVTDFDVETSSDLIGNSGLEFYYVRSCFCFFEPFVYLRNNISGRKISNNQWEISFDILVQSGDSEYELKDNGVYTLTSR